MAHEADLDISSLQKAVASLAEAILVYQSNTANQLIRDAMIQRFEYTYELSYKMLRRYLEMSEPNAEEIDRIAFPQLIRIGAEKGLLLHSWDIWNEYRDARNITSHVYDEKKAAQVAGIIPRFFKDAQYLTQELQKRVSQ